jgi:sugar phosphate isomerase/epimerase
MRRRKFLQEGLAAAFFMPSFAFFVPKAPPKLAFSTLGCPNWSLAQIITTAKNNGYKGLEFRGIGAEINLLKCPELAQAQLPHTLQLIHGAGLQVIDLGASAKMHLPPGSERDLNLAEARDYIDLAQKLQCPYVRVFPDSLPKNTAINTSLNYIIMGLKELGHYAQQRNVTVLLESHGEVVTIAYLKAIMQAVKHPNVGLIWDIYNMYTATQEPVNEVHKALKKYIKHVHVKDGIISTNGNHNYTLLGQGNTPLRAAVAALKKSNYKGYYSFEWEKRWYPNLPEPEVALPHFAKHFATFYN